MSLEFADNERAAGEAFLRLAATTDEFESYPRPHASRVAALAGADRAVQLLVRWHQEWWTGAGYPDALRGEQIPLGARILRVADAYAALTDARPFRPAGTEGEARKHLTLWAGLEFDPQVVRAFLSLEGLAELRSSARAEKTSVEATAPAEAPKEEAAGPPREETVEVGGQQSENLTMNAE